MRDVVLVVLVMLTWFAYKEIVALRKCAIKRNFSHPTMAAIFNFTVKMVVGTGVTGALAFAFVCVYNWDLTSQLFVRIMVNLFH